VNSARQNSPLLSMRLRDRKYNIDVSPRFKKMDLLPISSQ